MKAVNCTVIDWNQRTVDLAAHLGVSPSVVSYHRLKNHLRKNDRANHRIDWSNVDWTQPNFLIASFKNATPGAVSAARKEHAPEELRSGYNVKGSHSKLHVRGNYKKKEVKVTTVDANVAAFEKDSKSKQFDDNFNLAYKLMTSPTAREAFALNQETDSMRDRYGRTRFGQSCLLARRLIERGVRFVTVNMFETVFDEITWDIHGSRPFTDITEMSKLVAPNFDQAFSALMEDLTERGLLKNTVVTALGEFGRTPKINPAGGRDHHPGVWTILMGGGPIKGGRVIGESDELGYAPKTRPVLPGEVAATLFKAFNLDPHHELPGPQGRPMPLVDFNLNPIRELF